MHGPVRIGDGDVGSTGWVVQLAHLREEGTEGGFCVRRGVEGEEMSEQGDVRADDDQGSGRRSGIGGGGHVIGMGCPDRAFLRGKSGVVVMM